MFTYVPCIQVDYEFGVLFALIYIFIFFDRINEDNYARPKQVKKIDIFMGSLADELKFL